jgi:alpha-glucosidase (family GH31 glycosyl hydrolase)
MTYIPIMDAGIAIRPWGNYSQYDEGLKQDIYLKLDNETHVGMVWPNQAAYPDWFHPNASSYWQSSLNEFH